MQIWLIFKLQNGKRYTPDFYLIKYDKYIEIKGLPYEVMDKGNQKESVELFRKKYELDIYYWDDLYNICNLPYKAYTNYRAKANNIGIKVEDYLGKILYLTYQLIQRIYLSVGNFYALYFY